MIRHFRHALLCGVVLACGTARAGVNLVNEVVPPVVTQTSASGARSISFVVKVTNAGTTPAQGSLALKPILLPAQLEPSWSSQNNGYSLESMTSQLNLAGGESAQVFVSAALPAISMASGSGAYLLSVIANTKNTIAETDYRDNASDLVAVTGLAASPAGSDPRSASLDATLDLYHEVRENYSAIYGGLSHASRTIKSGAGSVVTRDLWAQFFLFDLQSRHGYGLPYNTSSYEKNWYAISWNREQDPSGNPIEVDYYSQAPIVEAVPAGNYAFVTLINSREIVPETNPFNNLHVRPIELSGVANAGDSSLWLVLDRSVSAPASKSFRIRNSYGAQAQFSASLDASTSVALAVTPASGTLEGGRTADLTVTASAGALAEGQYSRSVTVRRGVASATQVNVTAFVWDQAPRNLEASTTAMTFSGSQANWPAPQSLTLRNTSSQPIRWRSFGTVTWLSTSPVEGEVAPGETATVRIEAKPYGMGPRGRVDGSVRIQTSASNTDLVVFTQLDYR